MSASRSVRSPWNLSKRLRIQPAAMQQMSQRAAFNTSSSSTQQRRPPTLDEQFELQEENTVRSSTYTDRPQDDIRRSLLEIAASRDITPPPFLQDPPASGNPRLPRSVQALYLAPLRRTPTHGIPVANLQLRSYSVRNLEFMADFAMRAAYYLNLPARGPVPLPRITERWTVPRSNFIFKKSQENYERITVRRLIQIQDGHPESVQTWLAFVKKWCWYGVGMKADVFEFEGVGTAAMMDANADAVKGGLESVNWELFGRRKGLVNEEAVAKLMMQQGFTGAPSKEQLKQKSNA